jgi:hypothetical protein
MKTLIASIAVAVTLLGSTAYGGWRAVAAYYPAPVYAYPAPVYAYPAPVYAYRAPAPYAVYSPVVPAPMVVPAPAWVGPPVVVRARYYVPGRPVRNAARAVWP